MRILGFWVLLLMALNGTAQHTALNKYLYVWVPDKFKFQSDSNEYNINTLFKLHLKKAGFEAYLSTDDLPLEMMRAKCNYLVLQAEKSGFLNTKIRWSLVDCNQEVLYTSAEGISKEKDVPLALRQAIAASFEAFAQSGYQYEGRKPVLVDDPNSVDSNTEVEKRVLQEKVADNPELFYFAQPIANGFQVVDSTPKVIMRLFHTTARNIFIGVKGDTPGVLFQKNNQWFFEYYEQGKLQSVQMNIRF